MKRRVKSTPTPATGWLDWIEPHTGKRLGDMTRPELAAAAAAALRQGERDRAIGERLKRLADDADDGGAA
jgi:hypothetical protein